MDSLTQCLLWASCVTANVLKDTCLTGPGFLGEVLHEFALLWQSPLSASTPQQSNLTCLSPGWLQVLEMLLAAGLTLDNPLLPTLFRVGRIADRAFALLEKAIKPEALPLPSSKLLISVASKAAKFSTWSDACNMPRETLALNMPSSRLSRTELIFGVQGFLFKVDIPEDDIAPEEGKFHIAL